jgi:hypothetical protein
VTIDWLYPKTVWLYRAISTPIYFWLNQPKIAAAILQAKSTGELHLVNMHLDRIPSEIETLTDLKILSASH